ncbi:hypothetical protein BROUX41_005527 [Berkeleyomyces rouxiae]|uniref:uncharacterized protein n=1 Tax=Berkeleyomyces rouxiae TaxID=2035830 RepID=UPI003B7B9839
MKRQSRPIHISTSMPPSRVPRYVSPPPTASTTTSTPDRDYVHNPSPRTIAWSSSTYKSRMDIDTPVSASFYNSAESNSSSSLLLSHNTPSPSQDSGALSLDSCSISEHTLGRRSHTHAHSKSLSQPQSPSRLALHQTHTRRSSDTAMVSSPPRTLSSYASVSSLNADEENNDDVDTGDDEEFQLPLSQEPQSLTPAARRRLVRSLLRDKARTNKGKKSKYSVPVSYKGEGGTIKKRWLCLRCGYPASTSGHASRHHNTVHEVERPFTCRLPNCGHGFKRHDNQVQHEKTRHNLDLDTPGFDPDGSEWRRALAEEEAFKTRRNNRKNAGHSRQKSSMSSATSSEWCFDKSAMPGVGTRRTSLALSTAPMASAAAAARSALSSSSNGGPPTRPDYRHSLVFLCGDRSPEPASAITAPVPAAGSAPITLPPLTWTPRGSVSGYSQAPHRAHHRQLPSISMSHASFQGSEYELSASELSPVAWSQRRPVEPLGPAPHFQTPNYQQASSYAQQHQSTALWASR